MNDKPPKCGCAPCLEPAMINSPDCWYHWRDLRGWDETKGEYLPFSEPVNDPDYAGDEAYAEGAKAS